MKAEKINMVASRIYRRNGLVFMWILLILSTGCTSDPIFKNKTAGRTGHLKGFAGDFKKRIGIARFENKTAVNDQYVSTLFDQKIVRSIQNICPNTLLETPDNAKYRTFLGDLPRMGSGSIDNFALSMRGRELGFNAIVTGTILDISGIKEKAGILWFRSDRYFIQMQIAVSAYSSESGAKILDEVLIRETKVDESDFKLIRSKKIPHISLIQDEIMDIAKALGGKICHAVDDLPWRGFISSVKGKKIMLSSGRNVGIKPGDIFEVDATGKIIKGADGHQFIISGQKTGKIKIVSVHAETSEAILLSGKEIKPGNPVRPVNR